jgi:hypothetical protein
MSEMTVRLQKPKVAIFFSVFWWPAVSVCVWTVQVLNEKYPVRLMNLSRGSCTSLNRLYDTGLAPDGKWAAALVVM